MKYLENEKPNLIIMAIVGLAILTGWLLMGWGPNLLMTAHDGAAGSQPLLRELVRASASWQDYIYLFKPMGGNLGHDVASVLPFMQWALVFGFSAFSIEIIQVFLLQFIFTYFVIQFVIALKKIYIENAFEFSVFEKFFLAVIVAFSPFLAWRIWYGHELLILGSLPFIILNSLWAQIYADQNKISISALLLVIIGLINTIPSSGQQTFVYSAIFGLPFTLWMGFDFIKRNKKIGIQSLLLTLGILATSIMIIAPQYFSILTNALNGDSSRGLGTEKITYSYVTGELYDWFSSLTLIHEFFPASRNFFYYHEINYGFGPLILFPLLAFRKKLRKHYKISLGVFCCLLMSFIFTNNYFLSDEFIELIPILKNFRVPHRSILVLMGAIYTFALFSFEFLWADSVVATNETSKTAQKKSNKEKKTNPDVNFIQMLSDQKIQPLFIGVSIAIGITAFLLKIHFIEILVWLVALFFIVKYLFSKHGLQKNLRLPFLILLAFTSLIAFQERQISWVNREESLNSWDRLETSLLQMAPSLKNPLVRAKLGFQIPILHANTGFAVATGQIEGYMPPTSRFSHLISALDGSPFDTTRNLFQFNENSDTFAVMQALYNVAYLFDLKDGSQLQVRQSNSPPGSAWFPSSWTSTQDWYNLANTLKTSKNNLRDYLQNNGLYLATDLNPAFTTGDFNSCKARSITVLTDDQNINVLNLKITKGGPANNCIMALSTNYSKKLKATDSSGNTLATLPVYGSLMGVVIAPDTEEIILKGNASIPGFIYLLPWLGMLLLLGYVINNVLVLNRKTCV
jgi:hypothetical protein